MSEYATYDAAVSHVCKFKQSQTQLKQI